MNCFSTNADPNQISRVFIQSHELLFIRPVGAVGSGLLQHQTLSVLSSVEVDIDCEV